MSEFHEHEHGHPHDAPGHAPPAPDEKVHSYYQLLGLAMKELLIEKGVFDAGEIARAIEKRDAVTPALGAAAVARAWTDPQFKERLLADGSAALRELGLDAGALRLVVKENTPSVHNVIVCTLCSCYPRDVLGLPPSWYKSIEYRARVVREPRAVLREFGTNLADDVAVCVHDSTADVRYLVLPMRPAGAEDLGVEELAALVTRDCMVGVALPAAPTRID
ncbi:MAG TPA: nitrile hydratase subunit alpha [Beijerinckiaceae bacterium]|nr:nitrile hydratase subunit alpha [Beijerinckiaceae bacterium]